MDSVTEVLKAATLTATFWVDNRRVTARVVDVRKDESGEAMFTTEDAEGVRRDVLARMTSVDRREWPR